MDPDLVSAINQVLVALLLAVATAIGVGIRSAIKAYGPVFDEYLKAKIGNANMDMLKAFADTIVRNLRQNPAFSQFSGDELKARAVVSITEFCRQYNLDIDAPLLESMIEEAVQRMKAELGEGAKVEG